MIFAYFAYPIDVPWAGDHFQVVDTMRKPGWLIFDPVMQFRITDNADPDPRVQEINNEAIDRADVVVALLPIESHSVGVPIEIQRAADLGKPVLVWRQKPSWAIAQAGVRQFTTIEELCAAISTFHVEPANLVEPTLMPTAYLGGVNVEAWMHTSEAEVRITGDGRLPTRAYPDDAGFDLYVQGEHGVSGGQVMPALIPCGVAVELPPGWWGLLVPRSSTFNLGLIVNPGIIDPGWRGGLFAAVRNLRDSTVLLHDGDRIAQLIPIPAFPAGVPVRRVDQLSPHERGTNGFGSTGR